MASILSSSSNANTIRDVSFSSYLNSSEEAYVRSLVESTQKISISDRHHESRRKNKGDVGEIDVFGAEKYFNGGIDDQNSSGGKKFQKQYSKDRSTNARLPVNRPETPNSQSEASWNSQSALLKQVHRISSKGSSSSNNHNHNNVNVNVNNNDNFGVVRVQSKRSFLPCYCCDKSAIDIEEKSDTIPSFVFPVSDNRGLVRKIQLGGDDVDENTEARKSLEVFGSGDLDIDGVGNKSFNLERRLRMLSWDAIPRPSEEEFIVNPNPSSGGGPPCESLRDDTGSDASSDLFEIECLSCTANPVVVGVPSQDGYATSTTCYAPSEASIEWSVVTASAADFSAISDSEDQRSTLTAAVAAVRPPKSSPTASKTRPGMLLGCKSQKAVRVAGEAVPIRKVKKSEKQRTQMNSKKMMSRFQAEAKVVGGFIGAQKQRQDGFGGPSPSPRWSHSSHASELLYIH